MLKIFSIWLLGILPLNRDVFRGFLAGIVFAAAVFWFFAWYFSAWELPSEVAFFFFTAKSTDQFRSVS